MLPIAEMKQYGALTDFKCPILFSSEFSILPLKISEYLRADSPWNANTRIMKIFYKTLNVNELYLRYVFLNFKKHHSDMWLSPFQGPKSIKSHLKIGLIRPWNRLYQKVRWSVSYYIIGYIKVLYGLKEPFNTGL